MSLQKFIGHDDIMKLISLYAPLNGEDVSIYTIRGMLNEHDDYLKHYMDERLQNNQYIRASESPVLYTFNSNLEVLSGYGGADSDETYTIKANRNGTIMIKASAYNSKDSYGDTCNMVVYVNGEAKSYISCKTIGSVATIVNISKGDNIKIAIECGTGITNTLKNISICGTLDLGSTLFEEVTE